ncbi:beta-N-acetylhexosaminidase [Rhodobacter sp. KR11]|uniref:beta-N-acetylhexosaminidase n=1 Tax=Rhodobacter sp. KR11 TaxID=2974588 RepID=UPI002222448B|nr:beta-N-acetylhexosaminidase [Rhodobacter sp. KR11]MCW1917180.1 beta-N-acetylhexosaminidase [Rhodobacter sp. KR11]
MHFTAEIQGPHIACTVTADRAIKAPTFCTSIMAPGVVVSGGVLTRQVAGYLEVALPDLVQGQPHALILAHENPDFIPRNRAWLPLGAYLRTSAGPVPLPPLEQGVRQAEAAAVPDFPGLRLIPQPQSWTPSGAVTPFAALTCAHPAFAAVDALARRRGLAPFLGAGPQVTVTLDPALGDDHILTLGEDITLQAGTDAAVFHAAITLLTLRETHGSLPHGRITDGPRFGYRGQHLDCARHFFGVETILKLLDLMALMKLNRFHWHFSDDEAFRLETQATPEIWQKTALRGEGHAVPSVFGGGISSGGSYSRADVARILDHAAALHIQVLPEIEVPAHSFCLNLAHPGLQDRGDNRAEVSIQGYRDNIVNPALPETWAFLEPLALEVARLFPMAMIHLGGDELPPDAWAGSPEVTALKAREGLATHLDVQGWTMARMAGFLADHGFRSAAWEEATRGNQGGIGHDALIFSWTGQGEGVHAARKGHQVVMCPAQNTYFDIAHSADAQDWGATWAGITPLEQVVNWKPVPDSAPDIADRVVGVEGCFWGEFTTEDAQMEPMVAPRILGLANKAWDRADSVDGPKLRALAQAYAPLLDRIGWQRHRGA